MLRGEIQNLISLKQEGPYWDFKREWYSSDSDLLHDLICMANNLENRDAYIVIGVDEEIDFVVRDIKNDQNRKNTQKIVDFLKDKKFAGGIRPTVYVEPIHFGKDSIDVIVVRNSFNTPYCLIESFQGVYANNIYTRIMDTNTPKNRTADIHHIEYLWKKRFKLISTPLERVELYLNKPEDWVDSPTNGDEIKKYHKHFPEFTIEYDLEDDRTGYEYYLFNQTDNSPHWNEISIHYHQTMLFSCGGISLDGGRYFTSVPETDGISLEPFHHWDVSFKYFIKNSLRYIIHQFYYKPDGDEATTSHERFLECVLVFESEEEKEDFKNYIASIWQKKDCYSNDIWLPFFEDIKGYNMEVLREEYLNVQILQKMLIEFRGSN